MNPIKVVAARLLAGVPIDKLSLEELNEIITTAKQARRKRISSIIQSKYFSGSLFFGCPLEERR